MAEAMIAGLLRGRLVEPDQVTASHPRLERRQELEREYGIRTVPDNVQAIDEADVILLAIKPQMLGRVGGELRPHLRPSQLVLSVIAGRRPLRWRASSAIAGSSGACPTRPPAWAAG